MKSIEITKREQYAKDFVNEFSGEFVKILDNPKKDQFIITRQRFATFLLKYGYLPEDWDSIPSSSDEDHWRSLLYYCTMVRTEMNYVSRLGLHGEPPFEAVVEVKNRAAGDITIRSLQRMAMVTYKEVGEAIEKHLRNKIKNLRQTHVFLMEPEQIDRLPEAIVGDLVAAQQFFELIMKQTTMGLEDYIKLTNKVAGRATERLQLIDQR